MRKLVTVVAGALASLLTLAARQLPSPPRCDEANLQTVGDLDVALSNKAIKIIRLASSENSEGELRKLIYPSATFSLGAGDVGRPLGTYLAGVRSMALEMDADLYRFDLWSSIPTPVEDACASRTVEVEFVNTSHSYAYPIKFTFSDGRLTKAEGWIVTFQSGSLQPSKTL